MITHYKGAVGYKVQNEQIGEIVCVTKNKKILLSSNISYRKFPCNTNITKLPFKGHISLKY